MNRMVALFFLDVDKTEDRHHSLADGLERGVLSVNASLDHAAFHRAQPISSRHLRGVHTIASQPHRSSLSLMGHLSFDGRCTLATINNESPEMNRYRIDTFSLNMLFSAFFSSCYLGLDTTGRARS